ncbi:MAG TPA: aminoglycoside phosphotransferase family protein [Roseiflexaceae bacterium]|nr:aminoglycoside phosphotransferase family protein [Roseiflexaceae bacterium]
MSELALHNTLMQRLVRRVRKPWTRRIARKELELHKLFAERLLVQLAHEGQLGPVGEAPQIRSIARTRSDVVVALLGAGASDAPQLVLKLPLTPDAERSTTGHRQVVVTLHELPELRAFCSFVPRPIAWGDWQGRPYYLETALPGVGAVDLVRQQAEPVLMKQDAARLILQLHLGTLQRRVVDDALFARLAGQDLALLRRLSGGWPEATLLAQKLDLLEDLLDRQIAGRELPFSWTHGDFWPGNLLIEPSTGAIGGVVDWDRASADQIPLHDLLHMLAYTRKLQRRSELGEEVVSYLLPAAFDRYERSLVKEAIELLDLPATVEFFRAVTLLYWLRFAATNLERYPAFQRDSRWLKHNVFLVLKRGI